MEGRGDTPSDRAFYRKLALLGSLGVAFAVTSAGGFVVGMWLDGKLGTKPILTLVLGLMGAAGAFVQLVRTINRANRAGADDGSKTSSRA